jgi:hypothetical protein
VQVDQSFDDSCAKSVRVFMIAFSVSEEEKPPITFFADLRKSRNFFFLMQFLSNFRVL